MTENLKQLSPPEKKVAAQVLVKNGYSTRTVEDLIGMDHATIAKWAKEETEEGYRRLMAAGSEFESHTLHKLI